MSSNWHRYSFHDFPSVTRSQVLQVLLTLAKPKTSEPVKQLTTYESSLRLSCPGSDAIPYEPRSRQGRIMERPERLLGLPSTQ